MLHPGQKVLFRGYFSLVIACALIACRSDTPVRSEAENIYMQDYESPENLWGFMDTTGQLVIPAAFDDVMAFSEGIACVNKGGKWGYIDLEGHEIIPFSFRAGWAFQEGFARVKPFEGPAHYISRNGKMLKSETWEATDEFSEGLAKVSLGTNFGFIDTSGTLVIHGPFSKAGPFLNHLAIVGDGDKTGVIQRDGHFLLEPKFTSIRWSSDGDLLICHTSDTAMLYDTSGQLLLEMTAVKIREASARNVAIEKDQKVYLVDLASKLFDSTRSWDHLFYLNAHRWAGKNEKGYFMLTESGKPLNLKPYKQINKINQGYAACYDGEYWGYLDMTGEETTHEIFGLAWDYKDGFARVAFKDGIAFINRQQDLAFYPPPGSLDMRDFADGLAPVQVLPR